MTKTIKAKYANGVITPLEPLDLADNTVLFLKIEVPVIAPPADDETRDIDQERIERKLRVLEKASRNFPTADIARCCQRRVHGFPASPRATPCTWR